MASRRGIGQTRGKPPAGRLKQTATTDPAEARDAPQGTLAGSLDRTTGLGDEPLGTLRGKEARRQVVTLAAAGEVSFQKEVIQ